MVTGSSYGFFRFEGKVKCVSFFFRYVVRLEVSSLVVLGEEFKVYTKSG